MWQRLNKGSFITALAVLLITGRAEAAQTNSPITVKYLEQCIEKLKPLHTPLGKPQPGDWLDEYHEPGQTFKQYLDCKPVTPKGELNTIYILPVGDFSPAQKQVLEQTREYMELFFGIPVKTQPEISTTLIPEVAQRIHPKWGDKQLNASFILNDLLKPRLPADAAAMIAFTSDDLWPGPEWNFVFGMANIRERVGVWSIYRNGDPAASQKMRNLCLLRTIKTAVHETSHMFTLKHCIAYECCMCGSNHLEESDKHPLYLCPPCLAKLCWSTQQKPVDRYSRLLQFCQKHGMTEEATMYAKAIEALKR